MSIVNGRWAVFILHIFSLIDCSKRFTLHYLQGIIFSHAHIHTVLLCVGTFQSHVIRIPTQQPSGARTLWHADWRNQVIGTLTF